MYGVVDIVVKIQLTRPLNQQLLLTSPASTWFGEGYFYTYLCTSYVGISTSHSMHLVTSNLTNPTSLRQPPCPQNKFG